MAEATSSLPGFVTSNRLSDSNFRFGVNSTSLAPFLAPDCILTEEIRGQIHISGAAVLTRIAQLIWPPLDRVEIKVHGQGCARTRDRIFRLAVLDGMSHPRRAFGLLCFIAVPSNAKREGLIQHLRCHTRLCLWPGGCFVSIFEQAIGILICFVGNDNGGMCRWNRKWTWYAANFGIGLSSRGLRLPRVR
jgi:hypothetical protein